MHKRDLIKQLNTLNKTIKPDSDWKKSNQEILYNQISSQSSLKFAENKVSIYSRVFANNILGFVVKPLASLVLMLALVFGGYAASVSAMKSSLPGDLFYNVKLTSERVQVNLTLDEEKKTKLELEFAQRRLDEINKIKEDPVIASQKESIEVPLQKFQESMVYVKSSLANLEITDKQAAVKVADLIEQKTDQYLVVLEEQKETAPEIAANTEEAIVAFKDTADKALSIVIEEYEAGQLELDPEQIIEKINKRLTKLNTNLSISERKIANIINNKSMAMAEPSQVFEDQPVEGAGNEEAQNQNSSSDSENDLEQKDTEEDQEQSSESDSEFDSGQEETEDIEGTVESEDTSLDEETESTDETEKSPEDSEGAGEEADDKAAEEAGADEDEISSPPEADDSGQEGEGTEGNEQEVNDSEATEDSEQLPEIEEVIDQPELVLLLLNEAKQLLADNHISAAFDKIQEADDILDEINKVINNNIELLSEDFEPVFESESDPEPIIEPETEIIDPEQDPE